METFSGNHFKVLKAKELEDGSVAVAVELGDKYIVLSLMQITRVEVYTPVGTDILGPDPIVRMQTTSTQNRVIKRENFDALHYHEHVTPPKMISNEG